MLKNKKIILAIMAALASLAIVFVWLINSPAPAPVINNSAEQGLNAKVLNSSLKEERDGKIIWELKIGEMEYNKSTDTNTMKSITGKWYREDGSYLDITADGGTIVMTKKDIKLQGNTKVVLSSGGELTADELQWQQAEDKIIANGNVKMRKDDMSASAEHVLTDTGFEKIRLEGNAEVQRR